jgi:hypothetical protein
VAWAPRGHCNGHMPVLRGGQRWPWQQPPESSQFARQQEAGALAGRAAGRLISPFLPDGLGSRVQVTRDSNHCSSGISHWQSTSSQRKDRNRRLSGQLRTNQKNLENQFSSGADSPMLPCGTKRAQVTLAGWAGGSLNLCALWSLPPQWQVFVLSWGIPNTDSTLGGPWRPQQLCRMSGKCRSCALLGPRASPTGAGCLRRAFYLVPSPPKGVWVCQLPVSGISLWRESSLQGTAREERRSVALWEQNTSGRTQLSLSQGHFLKTQVLAPKLPLVRTASQGGTAVKHEYSLKNKRLARSSAVSRHSCMQTPRNLHMQPPAGSVCLGCRPRQPVVAALPGSVGPPFTGPRNAPPC